MRQKNCFSSYFDRYIYRSRKTFGSSSRIPKTFIGGIMGRGRFSLVPKKTDGMGGGR